MVAEVGEERIVVMISFGVKTYPHQENVKSGPASYRIW